jgi:hypothetical protein
VSSSACERNWSSYSFVHDKKRNRLLPERAEALVYVYTNSKLLAKGKLTDEKRWLEVNLDVEDRDVPDSDEVETSHHTDDSALPDFDPNDVDDDNYSSPSMTLEDHWTAPNHVFDFEYDGGDEDADELPLTKLYNVRTKPMSPAKCDDICNAGLNVITDETVVQEEKNTGLDTIDGTKTSALVIDNVASLSNDHATELDNASLGLSQTRSGEVPKMREKSSQGLVTLSKEVRA